MATVTQAEIDAVCAAALPCPECGGQPAADDCAGFAWVLYCGNQADVDGAPGPGPTLNATLAAARADSDAWVREQAP